MATPDVRVRLSAEGVEEVVRALKAIETQSGKTASNTAKNFGALKGAIGGAGALLGTLGVALTVGTFVNFVKSAHSAADAVQDFAEKTGASATNLTALLALGRTNGAGPELIEKSLLKLNQQLDGLRNNEPAAVAAFKRIGLSAKDFEGLDAVESFALVSKAIGTTMPDAAGQGAAAIDLLGKSGQQALPLILSLSEKGMGGMIKRGKEMGEVLTNEDVKAIADLQDGLDQMGTIAERASQRFEASLAQRATPALVNFNTQLGQMLSNSGEWADGLIDISTNLLLEMAAIFDKISMLPELAGIRVVGATKALAALMRGNVIQAGIELSVADTQLRAKLAEADTRKDLVKWALEAQRILNESGKDTSQTGTGLTKGTTDPAATAKARGDAAKAVAQSQLSLQKAYDKARADADKRAFEDGLISLEQYYAGRMALIRKGAQDEVNALDAQRTSAQNLDEPQRAAELQRIANQERQIRIAAADDEASLAVEQTRAAEELGKKQQAIQDKIDGARDRSHAQALRAIETEVAAAEKAIPSLGVSTPERAAQIQALREALTAKATFDEALAGGQRVLDLLAGQREDIQNLVERGVLSQIEGENRIAQLERQRLPVLQEVARLIVVAANATGDPESIKKAQDFQRSIENIHVATNAVHEALGRLRSELIKSGEAALTDFLDKGIDNVHGFRDAVGQMVVSVAADLRHLASEILAQQAILSLLGLFKGGSKGTGLSSGVQQALGLSNFAEGGRVRGPGTETSDSIPAWLSNNEFVVRARRVTEPGALPFLHDFNVRGMAALRDIRQYTFRRAPGRYDGHHFAEGGLVSTASASSSSEPREGLIRVTADRGLVLEVLRSPAGQRLLVENAARNGRAMNVALSGD